MPGLVSLRAAAASRYLFAFNIALYKIEQADEYKVAALGTPPSFLLALSLDAHIRKGLAASVWGSRSPCWINSTMRLAMTRFTE